MTDSTPCAASLPIVRSASAHSRSLLSITPLSFSFFNWAASVPEDFTPCAEQIPSRVFRHIITAAVCALARKQVRASTKERPMPFGQERCRISASKLIEAWAMAMKPERRKDFEAALDSLKEDELRALEGLAAVRMEH